MQKKNLKASEQPTNYIFDITPGLEVLNAKISTDEIKIDKSVFTDHQVSLIKRMIDSENEKFIKLCERDYQEKLALEIEKFNEEKEKFEILREGFEAEKKVVWQNGNQAGIKQTHNQMLSQVTALTDQLKRTIETLDLNTNEIMQQHKEVLLELILKITRKVIQTEIKLNPEIVMSTIKNCLECSNEKSEIRIMVNTNDWTIVSENLKKIELSLDLPEKVEVVPSDLIAPGGCRVEYKSGSVDADIENQFIEIQRKVLKDA
jgi:flagellar assembly protein FliH